MTINKINPRSLKDIQSQGVIPQTTNYFASNQALLFIGEALVDEVVAINYQFSNPKVPVYGYNAEYYSVAARGKIIVNGNFSINYIQPDYLMAALDSYFSNKNKTLHDKIANDAKSVKQNGYLNPLLHQEGSVTDTILKENNIEFEAFGNKFNVRNALKDPKIMELVTLSSIGKQIAADPKGAGQIIENFKNKFWKRAKANQADREMSKKTLIDTARVHHTIDNGANALSRVQEDYYRSRPDQMRPFNLVVFHGLPNNPYSIFRVIVDIDITGFGQQISPTGQPQMETYSFIAKSII